MSGKTKFNKPNGKKQTDIKKYYPVLLILLFIVVYRYIFNKHLDLNGDNFDYLNYARSILQGHGYSSPYTPEYLPTNHYPPGYSTILAIAMFIVGNDIVLLKILNGLLFLGSIVLLYSTFSKIFENRSLAFFISSVLLLNTGLLQWSTILMSEMSYLFFSSLSLFFLVKYYNSLQLVFWKNRQLYFFIFAFILAYYIRTIGIAILGAFVLSELLFKRWKSVILYLGGAFILYLPWMIRNNIHGIKGRYMSSIMAVNPWRPEEGELNTISAFLDKMFTNFYDTVLKGFTEVLFPFVNSQETSKTIFVIVGSVILLVTLFGAWRMKQVKFFMPLYLLGNIFVFLVWHSGNGTRYVWPLAPFIAYSFFYGLFELPTLFKKQNSSKYLKYSFLILVLAIFCYPKLTEMNKKASQDYPLGYKNYFQLAKNVKQLRNKELMVSCRKPGMFHYFSETFVCNYAWTPDNDALITDMVNKNVDLVVIDQLGYSSTGRYLVPAINANGELFKNIQKLENPDTYLLQLDKEKAKNKINVTN